MGAQLAHADLGETDLSTARLDEADLTSTNLTNANLDEASLVRAQLRDAQLREASLKGANLTGAGLVNATFAAADLTNADLTGVDARRVSFAGAQVSGEPSAFTGARIYGIIGTGSAIAALIAEWVDDSAGDGTEHKVTGGRIGDACSRDRAGRALGPQALLRSRRRPAQREPRVRRGRVGRDREPLRAPAPSPSATGRSSWWARAACSPAAR